MKHGGLRGHARYGAAVEKALDGVEQSVIEAVGEREVQSARVRRGVCGDCPSGLENGEWQESAPGGMWMLTVERENGAAPLLG
jgi:hypothetical protein